MTPTHARFAVCAFVLLSAGVAGNLMLFQDQQAANKANNRRATLERQTKSLVDPAVERSATAPVGTSGQPMIINAQPMVTSPVIPAKAAIRPGQEGDRKPLPVAIDPAVAAAGDAPEVIAAIQRELQARGYEPGTPDGVAGAVTRAAIMAWEHDHGLPPTGEPTEAVMKAIVLGVSAQAASQINAQWQGLPKEKRARPEQMMRMVQQSLSALGYNLGKVSGRMNDDTERAIREFETDQNLALSGRISGPLVARLTRLTAAGRAPMLR
ncbi:MAG: peptidoglycan-binding domain-containing protein [Hyphomicrobiaceae bacterium]